MDISRIQGANALFRPNNQPLLPGQQSQMFNQPLFGGQVRQPAVNQPLNENNVISNIEEGVQQGLQQLQTRREGVSTWVWIVVGIVILLILYLLLRPKDNEALVIF